MNIDKPSTADIRLAAQTAGLPFQLIYKRVAQLGWDLDRAVNTPAALRTGIQVKPKGFYFQLRQAKTETHPAARRSFGPYATEAEALAAKRSIQLQRLMGTPLALIPTRRNIVIDGESNTLRGWLQTLSIAESTFYRTVRLAGLPAETVLRDLLKRDTATE